MSEALATLEQLCSSALARKTTPPTQEEIREVIAQLRMTPMCDGVSDAQAEHLAVVLEERHGVTMELGSVITAESYTPWLSAAKPNIDPYYWTRYRQLLTKEGRSGQVLAKLDEVTDRILDLVENPKKAGPWDRRGMVVGHVQSGKTGNYAGLICKAADAGYQLIVVIAGVHNRLRNQTQERLDEGFVGRDSARLLKKREEQQFIGVGLFDRTRRPVTFTNRVKDFDKNMATSLGVPLRTLREPALFVIKKNSHSLGNLFEWLKEHARLGTTTVDLPMLVIDDEADNASINTRHNKGEITAINGQIRDLLRLFNRSAYVGYTATPFANIFIDPDTDDEMRGADLFPKDFIVSLDPPTNYFGPERLFLDHPEAHIRHTEDFEEHLPLKHGIDTRLEALPESLKVAVRTFVVGRAIRILRGDLDAHCSMLVNASRFTAVQHQLRNEIHDFLDGLKGAVRLYAALPEEEAMQDPQVAALRGAWYSEYAGNAGAEWPAVQARLHEAAAPIVVVEVNSRSAGNLNYAEHEQTGLSVIAVGGFSLSRGLTLRGLMVSYFLRNSMMYDTLMQMGRWFGYHPGYEDLCRIWLPEEAEGWYAHVAAAVEELRDELRRMEAAGATPEEFGLKVRAHPANLIVTARNKLGTSERITVSVGLGNRFVETAILRADAGSLNANRGSAARLVAALDQDGTGVGELEQVPGGALLRGVPVSPILAFVEDFRNHKASPVTDTQPLARYIRRGSEDRLKTWDVLFAGLAKQSPTGLTSTLLGFPIHCQHRTPGAKSDSEVLYISSKQRVASRGVEKTGLTAQQVAAAEAAYRGATTNYPDRIYRAVRERPLLIVHLLAVGKEDEDFSHSDPVVAYSISFPSPSSPEEPVEYVVNTTWLRQYHGGDDMEDDEALDDAI